MDHHAPPVRQQPARPRPRRRVHGDPHKPHLRGRDGAGVRGGLLGVHHVQPAVPRVGAHDEEQAAAGGGGAAGRRGAGVAEAARGAPPRAVQQQLLHRERGVE